MRVEDVGKLLIAEDSHKVISNWSPAMHEYDKIPQKPVYQNPKHDDTNRMSKIKLPCAAPRFMQSTFREMQHVE
jgi:hypothetical protein